MALDKQILHIIIKKVKVLPSPFNEGRLPVAYFRSIALSSAVGMRRARPTVNGSV